MAAVIVHGAVAVDAHDELAAIVTGGAEQPPGAAGGGVDIHVLTGAILGGIADAILCPGHVFLCLRIAQDKYIVGVARGAAAEDALPLGAGEGLIQEGVVQPVPKRTGVPIHAFLAVVVALAVQAIAAEEEHPIFLYLQDDPLDVFRTIGGDIVLLIVAEGNNVALPVLCGGGGAGEQRRDKTNQRQHSGDHNPQGMVDVRNPFH